jgi:glucose/mannose-6-phosphate isomerase
MNLDDVERFRAIDKSGMIEEIDALPEQLEVAWDLGNKLPLGEWTGVRRVMVAGMGGSAIGADLLAAYAAPLAPVPILVWRDYGLPAFVSNPETLVVLSSHSGDTEEVLSAFQRGVETGAPLLAVAAGGALARMAEEAGVPLWRFDHNGQPRAAVGYSFGLLLAATARLGLIPDPSAELDEAVGVMREQRQQLHAQSPVAKNPAKRMAGQLMGRWPTVVGAGLLAPVARRWRTQMAELAKAVAQFEILPEADHNMVAGVVNPGSLFAQTMVVFLQASQLHPRLRMRVQATRQILMLEGFNTDIVHASGEGRLAQQWSALQFGDYSAFYLAMAYGVDPTPVEAIEMLKAQLRETQSP